MMVRPPVLVFLSYVVLLMSQAFGWMILMPSFAAHCKARATDPAICKSMTNVPQRILTRPSPAVPMPGE